MPLHKLEYNTRYKDGAFISNACRHAEFALFEPDLKLAVALSKCYFRCYQSTGNSDFTYKWLLPVDSQ